jgi:hypothetical protein
MARTILKFPNQEKSVSSTVVELALFVIKIDIIHSPIVNRIAIPKENPAIAKTLLNHIIF